MKLPDELPDGPTEQSTERNGVLSYATEWHALLLGLGAGLVAAHTGEAAIAGTVVAYALGEQKGSGKAFREIKSEPWYAVSGVILGFAVGYVVFGGTVDTNFLTSLL